MNHPIAADRSQPFAITGLILAGGAATRMGGADKGLTRFAGEPLAARAIKRLAPQVGALLISANRNLQEYERLGSPVIIDRRANHPGPMAGWEVALSTAKTPWILSVPCDAPFFPEDLAHRLSAGIGNAPAALVRTPGGRQPVFALLHRSLLPDLTSALDQGALAAGRWLHQIGAQEVPFDDEESFVNVNDPAALNAAEERLEAGPRDDESSAATDP